MKFSRLHVLGVAASFVLAGCNNKKNETTADGVATPDATTAGAVQVPSGRCKATAAHSPLETFFFFPLKNEFLARTAAGLLIEPLSVTESARGRVNFSIKSRRDPDTPNASAQTGSLTFFDASWVFDFSRYKSASCTTDAFDLTYKPLPELGIKAGTWAAKNGYSMTFVADAQRFSMNLKGETKDIYYRVIDKGPTGFVLGTSATPPSTERGDIWNTTTLTPGGDTIAISVADEPLVLSFVGTAPADAGSSLAAPAAAALPLVAAHAQTKSPTLRQGTTQVNGKLPPEVVQRVVRQNFGRFRLCYENGLKNSPTLTGSVSVKFIIDRSGAVSTAQDAGSDLPDQGVVSCVVRGFNNLSFPQPEAGIVSVVYPVVFNPGD